MLQRQPSFNYKIDSFYTIQQKKKSLYLWYNGNMIPNSYPSPQSYVVSYPEMNIQDKVVNLNSWKTNFSKYL